MHIPVFAQEVMAIFKGLGHAQVLLDGTFGRGGHTALLQHEFPHASLWAFDQDPQAIQWGKQCKDFHKVHLVHASFSEFQTYISQKISGILLDLGLSSPQLDTPQRGFSFRFEGPLDMRMRQDGKTAKDILHTYSEQALSTLFWEYGQERHARFLAKIIKANLQTLNTTTDLAQLICSVSKKRKTHRRTIHPATRVFQALRIEVNRELETLSEALPLMINALEPGGILVVISFHSLEDGITKRAMRSFSKPTYISCKKPIIPSALEIEDNPRARSAKLRWIQHCKDPL